MDGDHAFAFGKTLAVLWEVQKDEAGDDSPADSRSALDNEQPSPSAKAMSTLETTGNGTSKETTKRTREDSCGHIDSESLRLLLALIPGGNDEKNSGGKTAFDDSDEDAEDDQVGEVVDLSHHTCQYTPDDHDTREVDGRPCSDQDHVGRRLKDDIADEEHHEGD